VILTGVGTSISMLISGASGSYLSEKAEQRKAQHELRQAMGVVEKEVMRGEADIVKRDEVEKAMLRPIRQKIDARIVTIKKREEKDHEEPKTLHEKAEGFAGIIVSIINGMSPFLGGLVPIIPFFFVEQAGFPIFIISFFIILTSIIFLGIFLGSISNESKSINVLKMGLAFTLTLVVTIFFLNI
ncbi:MAG: VIT1/CCC1 transporter family protein, partial [Promethearchaeia archaeon]